MDFQGCPYVLRSKCFCTGNLVMGWCFKTGPINIVCSIVSLNIPSIYMFKPVCFYMTRQDSLFKPEGQSPYGQKYIIIYMQSGEQLHNIIMYRVIKCFNTTWYK